MRLAVAALATVVSLSAPAWAHGVVWAVGGGAAVVEFRYTSGEPVAHAAVAVRAPNEPAAIPGGRTDGKGRFAFLPEGNGAWAITADDGMGHVSTATIAVEGASVPNSPPDPFQASWLRDGWGLRILLGLSLIGNLAGLGYCLVPRARRRRGPAAP